jgi:hypothetical protein
MTLLVIIDLLLVFYIVNSFIEMNAMIAKYGKASAIVRAPNELEEKYQFIKGLH